MERKYKVSVVIPCYNGDRYLKRAVNSLLNQTLKELEIIIVNDGSKDSSLAIAQEFENKYDNVIIYKKKNEGGFRIYTSQGEFDTRYVVNAAGVYADQLHNMVSEKKLHITARRGEYCLLDKSAGNHVSRTIFSLSFSLAVPERLRGSQAE